MWEASTCSLVHFTCVLGGSLSALRCANILCEVISYCGISLITGQAFLFKI